MGSSVKVCVSRVNIKAAAGFYYAVTGESHQTSEQERVA